MGDEYTPSAEAQRILNMPFPAKRELLRAASPEVKAEVAMICVELLDRQYPQMKELTAWMLRVIVDAP